MKEQRARLPDQLRPLFWDYDFDSLTWEDDRDLIVARILSCGHWEAIRWLRQRVSNRELRNWIVERRGRGLNARQLRFWELILELPREQVNAWLASPERRLWEERVSP